jgi:RNA polymerase sigma factor (sigma-70 family)
VIARDDIADLYRRYAPVAHRRALHLLGGQQDAEDVVSELFTSLYERPEQFRGEAAFSSFLYRATTHACLKRIRDSKNRLRLLEQHAPAANLPRASASADSVSTLHAALRQLKPPLGALAVYYYLDELTHQEIADLLDCSRRQVGVLRQRLDESLQHLGLREVTP